MSLVCENCGYEASGRACPQCHESAPLWAKFCPHCGAAMEKRAAMPENAGPMAIENRRACPDGNCIGILGADGRCILCGQQG